MIGKNKALNHATEQEHHSAEWVRGLESSRAIFDERALAVFQLDILIPDQFLATYKRKLHLDPERALMFAILQDAVVCFQEYAGAQDKRRRRLFLDAEEWLMSDDHHYLFSFENVCASLGLNASYLRRGLMRWKEKSACLNHRRKLAS
jgi:hypothetical protein